MQPNILIQILKKSKVNNHHSGVTYECSGQHETVDFFSKVYPSIRLIHTIEDEKKNITVGKKLFSSFFKENGCNSSLDHFSNFSNFNGMQHFM